MTMASRLAFPDDDSDAADDIQRETPALMNAVQLAKFLSVSERTLYRLKSAGKLPKPLQLGGSVRWRRDTIQRWIAGGCKPPGED